MDKADKRKVIVAALGAMFETYEHSPSEGVVKIYVSYLIEHDVEQALMAIRLATKDCDYTPRPSQIIKHLENSDADIEARAVAEVGLIKPGESLADLKRKTDDKITIYLMSTRWTMGEYGDTGSMTGDSFMWFQERLHQGLCDDFQESGSYDHDRKRREEIAADGFFKVSNE